MARPKVKAPSRRYHLSGQSVVTIDGKDFYLGKHDSPESIARYAVLIAQYQQNGCRLPESFSMDEIVQRVNLILGTGLASQYQADEPITVRHVTASFREFAKIRYVDGSQELPRINRLCDELDEHDGSLEANQFGPLALQRQRDRWVKSGISRRYVNRQVNLVVRIFKRAVSQELVESSTWQRLKSIEPLRQGQTTAPETEAIKPVSIELVRATAKYLSPVVRSMVRIQLATGMRPGEVCNLRPCDLDRTNEVWMFRPAKHKTANKGIRKAVPILGDAREAVMDYLNRGPESYCFSPIETTAWLNAQKRSSRQTKVQPSQLNRKKDNPRKQPGERYDSMSYRKAIQTAAIKAGVKPWNPYQMRHLAGTVVRDALTAEHAQALLGHSEISMTEHYTKTAEKKAIEAAQHAPKL